jgi:hypothetical protein
MPSCFDFSELAAPGKSKFALKTALGHPKNDALALMIGF